MVGASLPINKKGYRMLTVTVEVYKSLQSFEDNELPFLTYTMDHDDPAQRRVLGQQCRSVFESGQLIMTYVAPAKV